MCDKLVFDLSQEVEGSPNVFIRKDWINILDNMNQNYQNNQCIIDTSQLANSNKYMAYRESYLAMPMLGTITGKTFTGAATQFVTPGIVTAGSEIGDFSLGLKNWFGSMIHSFTLDYNGTTIIQQTPFINMWNIFKLLTSLSYQDVLTMGPTIGFYPDTFDGWSYAIPQATPVVAGATAGTPYGPNMALNQDVDAPLGTSSGVFNFNDNIYNQPTFIDANPVVAFSGGNFGLTMRTKYIAYNPNVQSEGIGVSTYGNSGIPAAGCNQVWKSYISTQSAIIGGNVAGNTIIKQYSIMAIIYLRHVHSFFNMCPLLKGVFMKLTMNLNNCSSTVRAYKANVGPAPRYLSYTTQNPVGGVCPFIIPSSVTGNNWINSCFAAGEVFEMNYNLSVGARCLNPAITALAPQNITEGQLSKSVYLYVPAYTFNPPFEQAYLSNSVKQIKYTDVYQYQYQTEILADQPFNFLVTNGIANIKSVLIVPFLKKGYQSYGVSAGANAAATTFAAGTLVDYLQYQSPFDTAGCGTTAPMTSLGNFNVQISGQNAIYNTQRYTYEEFVNQLYGQNSVNGGMTDGLTSGLIGFLDFQNSASYYYVNVERMLPVEQSVPKSVQIIGTNFSAKSLQFWIFIEYGVEVKIDVLTGARV